MDNAVLKSALVRINNNMDDYRQFARYYAGNHNLAFATSKYRTAFGNMFSAFSDNLMPSVVDPLADRMQIEGFGVEEGDESAGAQAWAMWKKNRMERRAGEAHLEALKSGDCYVLVWPDGDGNPTIYANKAELWTVEYDSENPGTMLWAAKVWVVSTKVRVNIYYSDRIEKYISQKEITNLPTDPDVFEPFYEEGEAWPMMNPYGRVPVFHFANNASVGELGQSELANVIPIQDALNKSVTDMMVAMEFVALPQRWVTGLEVPTDPATGKPLQTPFTTGVDRIWATDNPDAKFGEFGASSLDQFINVQESFRSEIARISATPLHYLLLQPGNFPSGESLKTAEVRFLSKVRDRMSSFGEQWCAVMEFCLEIAGMSGVRLTIDWKNPQPHSEKEAVDTAKVKLEMGIPLTQILKELNYTDEEIATMLPNPSTNTTTNTNTTAATTPTATMINAMNGLPN